MKEVDAVEIALKPLTLELLRLLSDGDFHSGEVLAQKLGVSRASVNNALHGIEQYGLTLYSVRGRGYCLANPPQWLNIAEIKTSLAEKAGIFNIEILDEATSTNTLLLKRAATGQKSGSVIAAEWQSGGRGRLGRAWHSGLGNALTFSLLWRFECGLSGLSGLSLATGVALMRAFQQLGINSAQLKWPNDIMTEHGKVAGILIEAQGDMLGPSVVVFGIGINLSLPQKILQRIDQPVSDLSRLAESLPSRNHFLATVLGKLDDVLSEFADQGFAALREEWESAHFYQNKQAQLLLPDGTVIQGIVRGVNQDGALLVAVSATAGAATEIRTYHSGEISIRRYDDSVAV